MASGRVHTLTSLSGPAAPAVQPVKRPRSFRHVLHGKNNSQQSSWVLLNQSANQHLHLRRWTPRPLLLPARQSTRIERIRPRQQADLSMGHLGPLALFHTSFLCFSNMSARTSGQWTAERGCFVIRVAAAFRAPSLCMACPKVQVRCCFLVASVWVRHGPVRIRVPFKFVIWSCFGLVPLAKKVFCRGFRHAQALCLLCASE